MSDSYTRNCKSCKRRIQMRKMPHGQWVAFEGYDTVHNCAKPPVQGRSQSYSTQLDDKQSQANPALSGKFGFADFNLDDFRNQDGSKPVDPPSKIFPRNSPREETQSSFSTTIQWVVWIVIIFLIIRFLL